MFSCHITILLFGGKDQPHPPQIWVRLYLSYMAIPSDISPTNQGYLTNINGNHFMDMLLDIFRSHIIVNVVFVVNVAGRICFISCKLTLLRQEIENFTITFFGHIMETACIFGIAWHLTSNCQYFRAENGTLHKESVMP